MFDINKWFSEKIYVEYYNDNTHFIGQIIYVCLTFPVTKATVVVNTTRQDLNLRSGGVSAAILDTAGFSIQDEASKAKPQGLSYGEIVITSGGKMNCQYIYHTCLDGWDRDGGNAEKVSHFL